MFFACNNFRSTLCCIGTSSYRIAQKRNSLEAYSMQAKKKLSYAHLYSIFFTQSKSLVIEKASELPMIFSNLVELLQM